MSWIEGIGDEVTLTVLVLFVVVVLLAAWISTGIREIPFICVIVRLRRGNQTASNNENSNSENQANENPTSENVANQITNSENATNENTTNGDSLLGAQSEASEPATDAELVEADAQETGDLGLQQNSNSNDASTDGNINRLNNRSSGKAASDTETPDNSTRETPTENFGSDVDDYSGTDNTCVVDDILSKSELRQRRLNFLTGKPNSASEQENVDNVPQVPTNDIPDEANETKDNNTGAENVKTEIARTVENSENVSPISTIVSELSARCDSSRQSQSNVGNQSSTVNQSSVNQSSMNQSTVEEDSLRTLPGEIRVKIKFLNETIRQVTAPATETIGNFRRRHFPDEIAESKLVRFIYNGQDLRNDALTLASYNIGDNSVLHCLITQQRQTEPQHTDEENSFDIGTFMFPLFGLLLGCVWYLRFSYRQFFNVTSTLTLGGISFLFVAAYISSFRRPVNRGGYLD